MGMYDEVVCRGNKKIDGEHRDLVFQTKDLDQLLIKYELQESGLYRLKTKHLFDSRPLKHPVQVEFTGLLRFYTHDKNDDFIVYHALFDEGKVLWIKNKTDP